MALDDYRNKVEEQERDRKRLWRTIFLQDLYTMEKEKFKEIVGPDRLWPMNLVAKLTVPTTIYYGLEELSS